MKIGQVDLTKRRSKPYTIWRDGKAICLSIQPMPLNFETRVKTAIPMPEPRVEFAREGNKILRDAQGNAVKVLAEQDPSYQAECARVADLRLCVMAAEALRADPQIQFETPRPANPWGDRKYAEAIERELIAARWTDGELASVLNAAIECSVESLSADVDAETERFLSGGRPVQGGASQPTQADPSNT